MLYTSLKQLSFHDDNRIKHHISKLELSSSLESISKHLEVKTTKLNKPACVYIYGEPGCGRSSLLLHICETFIGGKLTASEVFGVRVRPGCTLESLWNLFSEIAKERQDRETASKLTQSSVKLSKKYKVAQDFILSNFKLICVDDVSADGRIVWSHLSKLLDKTNVRIVLVSTEQECNFLFNETTRGWQFLPVEVKGLNVPSFTETSGQLLTFWKLGEEQIFEIYAALNGNPTAINIFINVVNEFQLPLESLRCFLLSLKNKTMLHKIGKEDQNAILTVLQFVFKHLTAHEKQVFSHLCQLREPLPVINVSKEQEKLARLGLLNKQAISVYVNKQESNVVCISVAQCLQLSSTQLTDFSAEVKAPTAFDAWYALLSSKLHVLITDAERNAWPFVPEKWQYTSSAGADERYNIKELITAKNSNAPFLTELNIMEECLFHAVKEKKYSTVAALVFVMDRFTYWQGMSQRTLQLVEYLKTNSPGTPIAPQLLIRNVRIMKNAGNLQGAEKVLDELLAQETQIGKWIYKTKHDHQLVSAVCIQIKGDIQYNLGQWTEGAKLLLESLILFSTLPIPDTKGISSSLVILGNCLQQMSVTEYVPVCQMYGLTASHPLLQAYYCACEAAKRSQYTPLFYARHKCRAGEFMLRYSQVIPYGAQRLEHLNISIEDFKDSIQAHKELQSLTSREEFYVFVCAVYKVGLAYEQLSSDAGSIGQGKEIVQMSMLMYEHYCSFSGIILLDDSITKLISQCLSHLGLSQLCVDVQDDSSLARSLPVDKNHREDTGKSVLSQMGGSVGLVERGVKSDNNETLLKERKEGMIVTDNLKETKQHKPADGIFVYPGRTPPEIKSRNYTDLSVDRDCETRECSSTKDDLKTATNASVDRCVVTVDTVDRSVIVQQLEQETVDLCSDRFLSQTRSDVQSQLQNMKLDSSHKVQGAIVWRFNSLWCEWKGEKTLAYVGNLLELEEGKEGAQRNAYMVEFVSQEDPLAKYVAKCYKKSKDVKQYQQDVICQMTARHYVTLFNQQLYRADVNVGHIQFLPVVLLQLVDESGDSVSGAVYNVEPYMAGEFVKLTNNFDFVRREDKMSDVVLAFSHFTYQASDQQLVIVDIQGWTPTAADRAGCTFLTDPQIHSVPYQCFGTGNLRQHGIDRFWKQMHPRCNDICIKLGLIRPNVLQKWN